MRALWAELRVQELAAVAEAFESEAPVDAQRLWRHVICLDPANAAARAGVARTPIVRVARPPIAVRGKGRKSPPEHDVWVALEDPLPLLRAKRRTARAISSRPAVPPPNANARAKADTAILEVERQVQTARFEDALASAKTARAQIARVAAAERPEREARLEVLAATAELALGRNEAARESLSRALAANPALALDAQKTSPKVLRALAQARAQSEPGEGAQ